VPALRAAAIASSRDAELRVSFPSVTTMITLASSGSLASTFEVLTIASYSVVPWTGSTWIAPSAPTASVRSVEKSVIS
jgi:hypothetical protein